MEIEKTNAIEAKLDLIELQLNQVIKIQKKQETRTKIWIVLKFIWIVVLIVIFGVLPIYFAYQLLGILDINAVLDNLNQTLDNLWTLKNF